MSGARMASLFLNKSMRTVILILFMMVGSLCPRAAEAKKVCPFEGRIDFVHQNFFVNFKTGEESSVSLKLARFQEEKNSFHLNLEVTHLVTPLFDVSTQVKSSMTLKSCPFCPQLNVQGQVASQYTLVNYKPVRELLGNFEIKDRTISLNSFSLGGVLISGSLELLEPFKINLAINLNDIRMSDFLTFWGADEDLPAQGFVSGQIELSGILKQPLLKGNLASYNGFVKELQYNSIVLNVEGIYPIVKLDNSLVAQSDGLTFHLTGNFNLADKGNFEKEIAGLKMSPVISEGKNGSEWTLKQVNHGKNSNAAAFKYFHSKSDGNSKADVGMLGIKRSINF